MLLEKYNKLTKLEELNNQQRNLITVKLKEISQNGEFWSVTIKLF